MYPMFIKKSILLFIAAVTAVFFVYPQPTQAQFKKDFLYKFQSRWSDIVVYTDGASVNRVFVINESYSRVEEYTESGVLQKIHGGFGTGTTQFNRPQGLALDSVTNQLYVLDSGNNRVVRYNSLTGTVSGQDLAGATAWGTYGSGLSQLNNPGAITISEASVLYIADTGNNRVLRCATFGSACTLVGSLGTYQGRFSAPRGIAYDIGLQLLYVADTGNNRIQIFNGAASDEFVSTFGTYGSGSSKQFVLPYRIVIENTSHNMFVLDTLNRVQRIRQSDNETDATITLGATGAGLAIKSTSLFVTTLPTTFQTYNVTTLTAGTAYSLDIGHPVDMALDTSGNIYINNNFTTINSVPVVQKFNSSFVQLAEYNDGGTGFGISTYGPSGIGINTGNDLYVADTDNNRVQRFVSDAFYSSLTPAPTPGPFNSPRDVATEATGKFYVADTGNGRVVKFDSNGTFTWAQVLPTVAAGTPTPPIGSVVAPYGITVDVNNKIYVADSGYHRILRYDANGTFEASWGAFGSADSSVIPQLDTPQGMAIGPEPTGYIYVADTGNNRVQRFDQNGTLGTRVVWGMYGTQDGNFSQPRNVAVDSSSRVFVSEVGNRRIQVFGDATASAGLTITQTGGTTIAEALTASDAAYLIDSYTVKLNTQPSSTVSVAITVSAPTQATVTTPTLIFTANNWNIPQTVTVVPTHDFISNGTHNVVLSHKPSSSDVHYANPLAASWSDVTVTINDTVDTPQINFSTHNVLGAVEGTVLSNAYSVVLNTKPTADVVVTLAPDSSMLVTPSTITFTPTDGNWNLPRWVIIDPPIHDYVAQGTHVGQITHTATSADPLYSAPLVKFQDLSANVFVTITDTDSVGVTFKDAADVTVAIPNLTLSEGGASDVYKVNLTSKPANEVYISISDASPSAMVSVSPSSLLFSPSTWTPYDYQTVTVSAIHDYLKNPINPRSTVIKNRLVSDDPLYDALVVASPAATITDTDAGGLLLFKPGGGNVAITEGGATDTYAMQLTSIPTNDVTVTLTSTDGQATTSAYLYTFTPADWNMPQYATMSAIDDSYEEGTHYGIIKHTLTSVDPNFNSLISYETATITDNDAAGIKLTLPNGVINLAEAGPSDTYYVSLNSQPTSTVTLSFNAQSQAVASPSDLTFTTSNWNVDQQITITAIQDYVIEGAHTAVVSYTGASSDTKYQGKTANFTANIADDDSVSPGVSIIETDGGTSVTKDAVTDTYSMILTSKPTANVKIKIVADAPDATTSAGVFWFTPNIWNIAQTVNIRATTNPAGSKTVKFTHLVTSLDGHYNEIKVPTVTVTVNENRGSSSAAANNAKPPVCSKTPPYSAPNLFQITTTQTDATLYFTPLNDNISYYFIAYGYKPGDIRFGTSFEFGPYDGVIDHHIGMLAPATTYYFTVRGGNGCATGPWSASVPATTVGPESSAQATRTFYAPINAITSGTTGSSGGSTGGSSPTGGIWLTRDLYPGSQGADVRSLQEYLNSHGFTLANSGVGSPGNETTYYGNLTAAAVRRFQEAHFNEILSPLGYFSGTGVCGPSTRGYINSHP